MFGKKRSPGNEVLYILVIKMAGYWSTCLWTEIQSRFINAQKRTRLISMYKLDRTTLVNKKFSIWFKNTIFSRDKAGNSDGWPSSAILPSRIQSQRMSWFVLLSCVTRHSTFPTVTWVAAAKETRQKWSSFSRDS